MIPTAFITKILSQTLDGNHRIYSPTPSFVPHYGFGLPAEGELVVVLLARGFRVRQSTLMRMKRGEAKFGLLNTSFIFKHVVFPVRLFFAEFERVSCAFRNVGTDWFHQSNLYHFVSTLSRKDQSGQEPCREAAEEA